VIWISSRQVSFLEIVPEVVTLTADPGVEVGLDKVGDGLGGVVEGR
jgi:hypothetical protein